MISDLSEYYFVAHIWIKDLHLVTVNLLLYFIDKRDENFQPDGWRLSKILANRAFEEFDFMEKLHMEKQKHKTVKEKDLVYSVKDCHLQE